jgi:hypothetical protein
LILKPLMLHFLAPADHDRVVAEARSDPPGEGQGREGWLRQNSRRGVRGDGPRTVAVRRCELAESSAGGSVSADHQASLFVIDFDHGSPLSRRGAAGARDGSLRIQTVADSSRLSRTFLLVRGSVIDSVGPSQTARTCMACRRSGFESP